MGPYMPWLDCWVEDIVTVMRLDLLATTCLDGHLCSMLDTHMSKVLTKDSPWTGKSCFVLASVGLAETRNDGYGLGRC